MNTHSTQHPPSAIELLSDVLTHAHEDNEHEIAEAIASIWLPVFRSDHLLSMALETLRLIHDSDSAREMCDRYLKAMKGMK
jgi:hypothetical protein